MISLVLSTIGLSQDSTVTYITLPEEQVKALLEDVLKYQVCEEQLTVKDSIITGLNSNIALKDSIIVELNENVELCEEVLETKTECNEWIKYVYGITGVLVTVGITNLVK